MRELDDDFDTLGSCETCGEDTDGSGKCHRCKEQERIDEQ